MRPSANWLASPAALLGILAVALSIVAFHIKDHPQFSRVDELQHYDYVLKSPSAGVRIGEQYGLAAMREVACRGIDLGGWVPGSTMLPECGDPLPEPSLSHSTGYNTAYLHTPLYYTVTGLVGEAVLWLPWVESSLVAYRLVGAIWLATGLITLWYTLGVAHVSVASRAALVGLLGVSPMVVHASAFINPDATAILGGSLVLLALLKWETKRWPWWVVPLVCGLAVWLKLTNVAVVGALSVYLLVRIYQDRSAKKVTGTALGHTQSAPDARARVLVAASAAGVSLVSIGAWRFWQMQRQLDAEKDLPIHTDERVYGFPWTSVDDQLRAVVTPFRNQWVPDALPQSLLEPLGGIADIGLLALLGLAAVYAASRSPSRAQAVGVFAAMVATGLAGMFSFYWSMERDTIIPGRYGLALLPLAAVAVAPVLCRFLFARGIVGALALATATAMLYGVLWYGTTPTVAVSPDSETKLGIWCSTTATTYVWRWNESENIHSYWISLDNWSWQQHQGTVFTLEAQPPNTEATLHVMSVQRAASGDEHLNAAGEPLGNRTCRTAPGGKPNAMCFVLPDAFMWEWDVVPNATRYRIKNDLAHPWFLVNRFTQLARRSGSSQDEAVLYVQAGNADGWNTEGTAVSTCRAKP